MEITERHSIFHNNKLLKPLSFRHATNKTRIHFKKIILESMKEGFENVLKS